MQNLHLMQQIDKQHRLQFGEYCQSYPYGYSEFLPIIIFTYESILLLNGHVNTQMRPSEGNEVPVNSPGIVFWCGISNGRIIAPYEVEDGTVTGESYLQLLIRKVFSCLASLR